MRIENLKLSGSGRFLDLNLLSRNIGNGTQESPFLIRPSENLPRYLRIKDSSCYIFFENCSFNSLILKRCQNMRVFDCKIEIMELEKDTDFEIEKCQFDKVLSMRNSFNIEINNCFISKFDLISSYENLVQNSKIDAAMNNFSSGNIFKSNTIPKKYKDELLKSKLTKKIFYTTYPIIFLIMFMSIVRLWNLDKLAAIWGISMISIVISMIFIAILISLLKVRKYGPNRLL